MTENVLKKCFFGGIFYYFQDVYSILAVRMEFSSIVPLMAFCNT